MSGNVKVFGCLARGLGEHAEAGGVRKPPGDETASRFGLGSGAERLWGFEHHALWDVVSPAR